jgi:hypothetical protein
MEFYKEGQESPVKVLDSIPPSGRQQFTNTSGQQSPSRRDILPHVEELPLFNAEQRTLILLNQKSETEASNQSTPVQQKFVSPENDENSPIT